ncbi:hypothetical protein [Bradyrhizobium canariense]|uniref:DUF680 domain-containing protein n=1 Tax=Bradyrhizobium canariense TaxID=255045 RepID=A0A1H2BK52_9BRAD|nr:hypothetical protein [Bradyrhizobium canariense]SDT58645.1 hypothetical protein SAMN05444158_7273 [Bradyrhizobium canariense]
MNTKRLALITSMVLFAAISGQAYAHTTHTGHKHWSREAGLSSQSMAQYRDGFSPMMPASETPINTHRYWGGPKYND